MARSAEDLEQPACSLQIVRPQALSQAFKPLAYRGCSRAIQHLPAAYRQEIFPEEEAAHPSGPHCQGLGWAGQESHRGDLRVPHRRHLPQYQAGILSQYGTHVTPFSERSSQGLHPVASGVTDMFGVSSQHAEAAIRSHH